MKNLWRSKRKLVVWLVLLFIVAGGFILPVQSPDGSQRFNNIEQHAAHYAVENAWALNHGRFYIEILGTIKITAEGVAEDHSNTNLCNGEFRDSRPGGSDDYLVRVAYRGLFNIPIYPSTVFHICRDR